MSKESMNPDERLWAAIRLEKPDRVPVIPTLLPEPAAHLSGLMQVDVAANNQVAVEAFFKVFDEYGGWDNPYPCAYAPVQLQVGGSYPMKMRVPGKDLPDNDAFQLVEEEILTVEDYDKIFEMGMQRFFYEDYLWRITDIKPQELSGTIDDLVNGFTFFMTECMKRNTRPFFMGYGLHPFFTLSLMRSLIAFTQDLYYNPRPIEKALRRMTDDLISTQIEIIKNSGINIWLLTEERASAYFYPPTIFERFWWPYTQEIVDACWAEGIVTIFHLDQCWDKNISYFKKLPKGSAILELDSATNIFAAKEIIRDHLCLRGDVSASLLSLGKPEDVEAYCRKLINEIGGDGGFILGSGCGVPPNVKPDNFRSMIETGKTYEFSKQ